MNDQSIRVTASPSMLLIFACFAVPIFLLFLYGAVISHAGWGGAAITGTLCALIFVWWRMFLLEISDGELVYRSLSQHRKIKLTDLRHVVRKIDLISHGNRPPNRLEIHGVTNGGANDFDINMKVFRLQDVRKIEAFFKVTHQGL